MRKFLYIDSKNVGREVVSRYISNVHNTSMDYFV